MARHNNTGKEGETLAVKYFAARAYKILHCNWRHRHWEIDIIAEKQGRLHFIEVKTRRTLTFGYPEESVTPRKMQYLINASAAYLHKNPEWKRVQFDVLSINIFPGEKIEYFLIEDVYL